MSSRKRLSWDEERAAALLKKADPYTMNQTRQNPSAEDYITGTPETFGEGVDHDHRWEKDKRDETGHAAPSEASRQAVVNARLMEDKALKCITVAQRMLPGASEDTVEDQATDLMFLPEHAILATLQRQSDLATKIAAEMTKDEEKEEEEKDAAKKDKKDEEEKDAAKKDKKEEEEKDAAKKDKKDEEEKDAAKKDKKDEEEKDAAKKDKKDEEEVDAAKKDKKEEEEVDSKTKRQAKDLLDVIFDVPEFSQEPKIGAKTLQGLVKQASSDDPLSGLWDIAPDVSSVFK
jgi:flagellar biosynthesis GTPase FlhF